MMRLKKKWHYWFVVETLLLLIIVQHSSQRELSRWHPCDPQGSHGPLRYAASFWLVEESHAAVRATDAGTDQSLNKDRPLGAYLTLHGSGSDDPDGNRLSYWWHGPFKTTSGQAPSVQMPEGHYTVSLAVHGGESDSEVDTATIIITPCFNISARAKSGKVALTWTHIEGTERYEVYRADESDPVMFVKIGETTSTYSPYLDLAAVNETTYLYVVGALSQGSWCYSDVISSRPSPRERGRDNFAPLIYSSPITHSTVGIIYNYDVNATDPNLDTLSYSLSTSPAGMTIDSATGLITWTPAEPGLYELTVEVADGDGETDAQTFAITVRAFTEPQPEGSFGSQYEDLIPLDATIEAYDPKRFSLITGLVHAIDDSPLSGVSVAILEFPEYGSVLSDAEGRFSIPVEGGETITAVYEKTALLTVQRKVYVPWNDIAVAQTIRMIAEDQAATTVAFDGNPGTVITHRSTEVADKFGSRACTMVFTGDNHAYELDSQGNVIQELTTITTRATEYTTPESMPAILPPTSSFTYCVEQSVDGVERVRFDKPVITWIDNFLGFAVGEIVPVGSYDRDRGVWVPEKNGVVVKLLDTDNNGIVDALDLDGDDHPNDLDNDGCFTDEVEGLDDPVRHPPGSTFWRAAIAHFTPIDYNWPPGLPPGATAPNPTGMPFAEQQTGEGGDCKSYKTSYVEDRSRIAHEDIPVPGTDMTFHYASNRVRGYHHKITVPASGETVPASLKRITVKLGVAGRIFEYILDPLPDQQAEFLWDGQDHLGRPVSGTTNAHIEVGFVYDVVYYSAPSGASRSFALAGVSPASTTMSYGRQEITLWMHTDLPIHHGAAGSIAEGWTLSPHHYFNHSGPTALHKGDGTLVENNASIVTRVAGSTSGYGGDGGPATEAQMYEPRGVAVDAAGNLYIADEINERVRKVDTNGIMTTVAGNGNYSFSGDGGLANEAGLRHPSGVALDARGNLYIADRINHRIRKVDTNGIIATIAGSGIGGSAGGEFAGDGGPATQARLNRPNDVAVDGEGNIYIADSENYRIRKINPAGIITTAAGNGDWQHSGDGGPATQAGMYPWKVALDSSGNLYIVDRVNRRVRKVDTNGIISTVAGNGSGGSSSGDGGPATQAAVPYPYDVAIDRTGSLYIADTARIRKVDTTGIISTVAGSGEYQGPYTGEGGPATSAEIGFARSTTLDAGGNLYIGVDPTDAGVHILKVASPSLFAGAITGGDIAFAEQNGLGHVLNTAGRHERTIDMNTGVPLSEFGYDADDNLVSITDQFGNQTIIERNVEDSPTAIISPYGITTALTIDADNHLTQITYPDGSSYGFEYTSNGLMTAKIEPEGNRFEHVFDSTGHLTDATDEEGGNWQFSRSVLVNGDLQSEVLSEEGNLTSYLDHTNSNGAYSSTIMDSTGALTLFTRSPDGLTVNKSLPCGMDLEFTYDVDSEYKFQYVDEMKESTPSGLEKVTLKGKTYEDTDSDEFPDRITETLTVNGKTTSLETDTLQATRTITSPEGRTVTTLYDPNTLLTTSLTIPGLFGTTYRYDARNRLTSMTTNARETTFSYDAQGNLASTTDPENYTTTYSYDAAGRMTRITHPDTSSVGFTYDNNGNMSVLTNPSGIDHGFDHNNVNLNSTYDTPLSGGYSYVYDKDRRLIQVNFPSGRQINNIYANGRLEQIQTPEGDVDLTYLCSTKMDSITKGAESITYGYDGSLVTSEDLAGTVSQSLIYGYNNDFNLTSFTYAGGTVSYGYDNDGLLTRAGNFTIVRNGGNGLPEAVTGGALDLTRTFNGYGEVEAQDFTVAGQGVTSWSFTRDNVGRITAKIETVNGITSDYAYTYDAMGRLLTVTKNNTLVEEYQYDSVGTRIYEMNAQRSIAGRTLAYDEEDHLLTAGDATYQYDLDGYLTTKTIGTDITSYSYSSRGEISSVALPDGRTVEYVHDPLGRRIAKKVDGTIKEKYLWHGLTRLLAVYDSSENLLERFEYEDSRMPIAIERGGSTYYLAYDQAGSLRVVADSLGNIIMRVDYDSFGNIIKNTSSSFEIPIGFAGGLYDRDTGLVRFGHRDYDPDIGRWTAKDPLLFVGKDVDLYGYCLKDPLNLVDPEGLIVEADPYNPVASLPSFISVSSGFVVGGYQQEVNLTRDPSRRRHYVTTPQFGGGFSINIHLRDACPSTERPIRTSAVPSRYLGVSTTHDAYGISRISFNIGFSLGVYPVNFSYPID